MAQKMLKNMNIKWFVLLITFSLIFPPSLYEQTQPQPTKPGNITLVLRDDSKTYEPIKKNIKFNVTIRKNGGTEYKEEISTQQDNGELTILGDNLSKAGFNVNETVSIILQPFPNQGLDKNQSINIDNVNLPATAKTIVVDTPVKLAKVKFQIKDNEDVEVERGTTITVFFNENCGSQPTTKEMVVGDEGGIIITSKDLDPSYYKNRLPFSFKINKNGYIDKCYSRGDLIYDPSSAETNVSNPIIVELTKLTINLQYNSGEEGLSDHPPTVKVQTCDASPEEITKKTEEKNEVVFTGRQLKFQQEGTDLCIKVERKEFVTMGINNYKYKSKQHQTLKVGMVMAKVKVLISWGDEKAPSDKPTLTVYTQSKASDTFTCASGTGITISSDRGVLQGDYKSILYTIPASALRTESDGKKQPLEENTYLFFEIEKSHFVTKGCPQGRSAATDAHIQYKLTVPQKNPPDNADGVDTDNDIAITLEFASVAVQVQDASGKAIGEANVKVKAINAGKCEDLSLADGSRQQTDSNGIIKFTSQQLNYISNDTQLFFEVSKNGYKSITCGDPAKKPHIIYKFKIKEDGNYDGVENNNDNDALITMEKVVGCKEHIEKLLKGEINNYLSNKDKPPTGDAAKAIIKAAYYQWLVGVLANKNIRAITIDSSDENWITPSSFADIKIFLWKLNGGKNGVEAASDSWLTVPTVSATRHDLIWNELKRNTLYGWLLPLSGNFFDAAGNLKSDGCKLILDEVLDKNNGIDTAVDNLWNKAVERMPANTPLNTLPIEEQVKRLLLWIDKVPCKVYKGDQPLCNTNLHKEYCVPNKSECVYAGVNVKETFCNSLCRKGFCAPGEDSKCTVSDLLECKDIAGFLNPEVPGPSQPSHPTSEELVAYFSICNLANNCSYPMDGHTCSTLTPGQMEKEKDKAAAIVCNFIRHLAAGAEGDKNKKCSETPICEWLGAYNKCTIKDYYTSSIAADQRWNKIKSMLKSSLNENRCLKVELDGDYYKVEDIQLFRKTAQPYIKAACEYQPGCIFDSKDSKNGCKSIMEIVKEKCATATGTGADNCRSLYTEVGNILQLLYRDFQYKQGANIQNVITHIKDNFLFQSIDIGNIQSMFTTLKNNIKQIYDVPSDDTCAPLCAGLLGRAIYYYDIALEKKNGGKVTEAVAAALKGYAFDYVLNEKVKSKCETEVMILKNSKGSIYKDIDPTAQAKQINTIIDIYINQTKLIEHNVQGAIQNCGTQDALNAFSNAIESRIQIDNFKDKDGCGSEGQTSDYGKCLTSALATFDPNACGNFSSEPQSCKEHLGCTVVGNECKPDENFTLQQYCEKQEPQATKCKDVCKIDSGKCVPITNPECSAFNTLPLDPQIRGKLCNGNNGCKFDGGQCKKKEQKKCEELDQKACEGDTRCWWVGQGESGKCRDIQPSDCVPPNRKQEECEKIGQGETIKCQWCKDLPDDNKCRPKIQQCSATPTTTPSPSACSAGSREECEGKGCEWKDGNCQPKPGTTTATSLAVGICPSSLNCKEFTPNGLKGCKSEFGGEFDLSKDEDKIEYAAHLPKRMISTSFNPVDICKWYGNEEAIERAKTLRNELRYLISTLINPWSNVGTNQWMSSAEAVESYIKWAQEVYTAYKKACEFLNKGGCTSPSARATEVLLTTTYNYLKACGIESERDPDYPRRLANCARKGFPSECSQLAGTFVQELQWVQKKCKDTQAKDCSNSASLINLVISLMKSGPGINISGVCSNQQKP